MFRSRRPRSPGVNIWMCFDNTDVVTVLQWVQKRPFVRIFVCFSCVCVHTFIYLHDIWKCFCVIRDTILLQEWAHTSWTCVRKEGRNSCVVQTLTGVWHIQTYVNKKTYSHMNLCAHTRNEERSPEKSSFLDSSYDQGDECLFCLTPDLLVVLHVLLPLLPSFHTTFRVSKEHQVFKIEKVFNSSQSNWAKKNK